MADEDLEDDVAEDAADGEEGEGGEGEGSPKKSKKKLIIIAAALLVVLLAGGGAAFYFLMGSESAEHEVAAKAAIKVEYYSMPEFLVNLNSGSKKPSYLKTTIVLVLNNSTDRIAIEANLPRLFDIFNTYLRELRASDLSGSAGIQRLREELLLRANQVLAPMELNDILFKEIIVQ